MSTLTDRYVGAAMRSVPEKQRADLAAELRASIEDQLDARMAGGEPHDAAERAVLTDLGDPDRLAADYTDRPLHLIGPRYFLAWWRLTKLLWAIVPVCAAFGVALGQTLSGASFGEIVGSVASVTISVIVNVGFWTTLVFFIVERSAGGADVGFVSRWTPDQLPEPHDSGARLTDLIASLVLLGVAAGAVLWDHFVGTAYLAGRGWTSFLAPELWPWLIGGLLVLCACEAILAIRVYAYGRWTARSASVNLLLNALIVVPGVWLLMQGKLVNPTFFASVIPESGDTVAVIVGIVFGFTMVGVAGWDSVDAFLKAGRAGRTSTRRRAAVSAQ
ncbi:permease prefix domain 1-containing protein [Microbacterium lushaniae]|nr:permease prefix domain 1-containing protein [Microbacterium lushaniae]